METATTTLRSYLTWKNPRLSPESLSGTNTNASKQDWKKPGLIKKWCDFDTDSLASIYDGSLKEVLNKKGHFPHPPTLPPSWLRIRDEDSLGPVLTGWSQLIVCHGLEFAQRELSWLSDLGGVVMCRGGLAEKIDRSKPDWAGVRARDLLLCPQPILLNKRVRQPLGRSILPGDTKVSSKFSSANVRYDEPGQPVQRNQSVKTPLNPMLPLYQVYNYCIRAQSRYGFIITDKELLALRLRDLGDGEDEVAVKVVQWSDYASNPQDLTSEHLTVNLALWWLHILAVVDHKKLPEYKALKQEPCPASRPNDSTAASHPTSATAPITSSAASRSFTTALSHIDLGDGGDSGGTIGAFNDMGHHDGNLVRSFTSVGTTGSTTSKRKQRQDSPWEDPTQSFASVQSDLSTRSATRKRRKKGSDAAADVSPKETPSARRGGND